MVHERDDEQDTAGDGADTPSPAVRATKAPARLPGDLIDLADWYLTLPTGTPGDPDTVENPELGKFTNAFFTLNDARDGVVFSAHGDGVTTKNSHYPRSELREMNGSAKAAWSNTRGRHTLDVCEAITQVPSAKPEVVGAQIHDNKDDVLQIRLEGQKLMVQYDDGKAEQVLDPAYQLGTPYHVRIIAADSTVDVLYNGEKKADLPLTGSGWYWKVGAYVQANSDTGDAKSTGAVTVYALQVNHSDTAAGPTDDAGRAAAQGHRRAPPRRIRPRRTRRATSRTVPVAPGRRPPPSPPPSPAPAPATDPTHPRAERRSAAAHIRPCKPKGLSEPKGYAMTARLPLVAVLAAVLAVGGVLGARTAPHRPTTTPHTSRSCGSGRRSPRRPQVPFELGDIA